MDVHGVADVLCVAAGERHADRHACSPKRVAHEQIARSKTFFREREPTEPIAGIRISAGEIEGELGARTTQRLRQQPREPVEVRLVLGVVREAKLEITCDATERKVSKAVNRERERVGSSSPRLRCP